MAKAQVFLGLNFKCLKCSVFKKCRFSNLAVFVTPPLLKGREDVCWWP